MWHPRTSSGNALTKALGRVVREFKAALPAARIVVKPNFIDPDPGPGPGQGGYAVFVGRLSREKGGGDAKREPSKTVRHGCPILIVASGRRIGVRRTG